LETNKILTKEPREKKNQEIKKIKTKLKKKYMTNYSSRTKLKKKTKTFIIGPGMTINNNKQKD
jgi:hypothetical protein